MMRTTNPDQSIIPDCGSTRRTGREDRLGGLERGRPRPALRPVGSTQDMIIRPKTSAHRAISRNWRKFARNAVPTARVYRSDRGHRLSAAVRISGCGRLAPRRAGAAAPRRSPARPGRSSPPPRSRPRSRRSCPSTAPGPEPRPPARRRSRQLAQRHERRPRRLRARRPAARSSSGRGRRARRARRGDPAPRAGPPARTRPWPGRRRR